MELLCLGIRESPVVFTLEIILPGAEREISLPVGEPEFGSLVPRGKLSYGGVAPAPGWRPIPGTHTPAILTEMLSPRLRDKLSLKNKVFKNKGGYSQSPASTPH